MKLTVLALLSINSLLSLPTVYKHRLEKRFVDPVTGMLIPAYYYYYYSEGNAILNMCQFS